MPANWKEIRIPVPWGYVAGKWWGPQNNRPIFASHGVLDNSETFDTLIPLLPKETSFLVIDYPGCGYSSKLPAGVFYHHIDQVTLIKRIVKYFKWDKVSFLGHSLGAMNNYIYAMLYPEEVDFLISLDNLSPLTNDDETMERMKTRIVEFLKYDLINNLDEESPSYSDKELAQKLHNGLQWVTLEKVEYILKRNTKPSSKNPSKRYFTIDPHLKAFDLMRWLEEDLVANAHRLTCPILILKTNNGPFVTRKGYAVKVIDAIAKVNKNLEIHEVIGAHHLHLNNPEKIAGIINNFLKRFDR